MSKTYWVYLLASKPHGTLYVGVTNDIARRAFEHRTGSGGVFTRRYDVHRLVWFEEYGDINEAIAREKMIKRWERAWKIKLIEDINPAWDDLYERLNA
jgi:putative endonuclease